MPKLIPITSTVPVGQPLTPQPVAGSPIGTALGVAGKALRQVSTDLRKIQEHNDAIFVTKSLAEMRSGAAKRMIEMKQTAEPGAKDFTRSALQAFHDDLNKRQEDAPSNRAAALLATRAATLRGEVEVKGLGFEVSSRLKKKLSDIDASIRENANAVLTDPSQYDAVLKEQIEGIKASGLPPIVEKAQLDAVRQTMAGAFLIATLRTNPSEAKRQLNSGKFDKDISPSRKAQLLARANAEIKAQVRRAQATAKADARSGFTDELASVRSTGDRLGIVSDDQLVKVFGEKKGRKLVQILADEQAFFTVTKRLSLSSLTEDQAELVKLKGEAKAKGAGFAARQQRINLFERAIAQKKRQLFADPAAFVLTNNDDFKVRLEEARQEPTKMEAFSAAILEEQRRMGVPVHLRQILPKSSAQALIGRINAEGDAVKRSDMITGLGVAYGDQFPKLYEQLVKNGLPGGAAAMFRLTRPQDAVPRRDMANALKLGVKGVNDLIPDVKLRKDAELAIQKQTTDLRTSLGAQGSGMIAFNREMESLNLLTKYYVAKGDGADDAARKAYDALIGSHYTFVDRLRIPAKFAGASGSLEADANAARFTAILGGVARNLQKLPVDWAKLPKSRDTRLSETQRRDLFVRSLISKGYWATNRDETGVVLLDELGAPIIMKNGRPLYIPFDVMTSDDKLKEVMAERFGIKNAKPFMVSPGPGGFVVGPSVR